MQRQQNINVQDHEVIVVGSGIAGLVCALSLAPRRVALITKTPSLAGGSSLWAKGGIAAALGPGDSPKKHAMDTLAAGAGLSDPQQALALAEDGVSSLQLLIDEGVPFDRALDGTLELAREAAHNHARVVHAGGDATGEILVSALIDQVQKSPSIQVLENTFAYDLLVSDSRVDGLVTSSSDTGWEFHRSQSVVLATGGIGMTWWNTTNPTEATGDGLAMAARAGARLADVEFVQFHPTALATRDGGDGTSLPLLTEALRGAGAQLRDESGCRFMQAVHRNAELAPRDVVARAIHQRISNGQAVFLDVGPIFAAGKDALFPQAFDAARKAGFEPQNELLPITPAAHYHMGGVQTDRRGRTSIQGLWACGEVATTGIHGANRLASNSLLEGLVYARRVADDVRDVQSLARRSEVGALLMPTPSTPHGGATLRTILDETRKLMSANVGISRSGPGLELALSRLADMTGQLSYSETDSQNSKHLAHQEVVHLCEVQNVLLVARLVTLAALQREESRGSHYREDFPETRQKWRRRQRITIDNLGS
jgi:L-aspartate oxidase